MDVKQKIKTRTATVAVIGQGYVGLPLAVAFASVGFKTFGVDYDKNRVARINRGVEIDGVASRRARSPVEFDRRGDRSRRTRRTGTRAG